MYNVLDIERAGDWIGVCEGELDTLTMSKLVGIPCVGVPGANSWKKHYTRLLADFERVFVFADGDPRKRVCSRSRRELPVTTSRLETEKMLTVLYQTRCAIYQQKKMGLNVD
jgi:hypothetical protein